jgi:WD40 repeat protein
MGTSPKKSSIIQKMLPSDLVSIITEFIPVWRLRHEPRCETLDLKEFSGGGVIYSSVVFSQGRETRVASALSDKTVKIWDATTGESVQTLTGHNGDVYCMCAISSTKLISGSKDGCVTIWDVISGECLTTINAHTSTVQCIDVFPNGNIITVSSWDETAKIWNPHTGKCVLTLEGHTGFIYCLTIISQCGYFATGSWDESVQIWDTKTGKCTATLHIGDDVSCLEVLSDNRLVVGCLNDNIIQIWDVSVKKRLQILKGDDDCGVKCLGILPNGNIVSGSSGGKIRIWDGQTVIFTVESGRFFPTLRVCPNGSVVIVGERSIDVWKFLENDRV